MHLRRDLLAVGVRVHVLLGHAADRHHRIHAAWASGNLRFDRSAAVGILVFQYAFADTCSTVTSGAMLGRCDFIGDLLYSVDVTGFIYPIIGHWAW